MVPAAAATVKSKGGLQSTGKVAESALAAGYRSVNIKDVEQKWELLIFKLSDLCDCLSDLLAICIFQLSSNFST